jgi:radical SAM protein with 4Fe4S-binding SPASM domain
MHMTVKNVRCNLMKEYQSFFDTTTGFYVRKQDPFLSPCGPELLDISITNKCTRSCDFCYQNCSPTGDKFIDLQDMRKVLTQAKSCFQIALGGGEPTLHPQFCEILQILKEEFNIIPNYTTNGDNLTPNILKASKKYCGAVAVSVYDHNKTWEATEKLIKAGVKTNWHYVLSKKTIRNAIAMLQKKDFPKGLNAIIFLLYKPIGRANPADCLTINDPIEELMEALQGAGLKGGFDACSMNYIIRYREEKTNKDLIDFCDSARYTGYVNWDLDMSPCSFNKTSFGNLKTETLQDVWEKKFVPYRAKLEKSICKGKCDKFKKCYGGCPLLPINLCEEKKEYEKNIMTSRVDAPNVVTLSQR